MKIAAPPPVGTGRVLIRRSFGSSTSRSRLARGGYEERCRP